MVSGRGSPRIICDHWLPRLLLLVKTNLARIRGGSFRARDDRNFPFGSGSTRMRSWHGIPHKVVEQILHVPVQSLELVGSIRLWKQPYLSSSLLDVP